MTKNFAVIGVGGYIAPRHLRAIKDTGNRLVAAVDPKDSVGILDQYSYDVKFFTEIERFDRHLEKLRRGFEAERIHYVSICSPNYLHDAHCRLALRVGADVVCEKPLVINPWNLDALEEIEAETKHRIFTILQLRVYPSLIKLRETLRSAKDIHDVELTYITSRGPWYQVSWKGDHDKSGGVATNIGIHLFDLLMWLFGSVNGIKVYHKDDERMSGFIELERARVRWFLSVDKNDLPEQANTNGKTTYRSITVDGKEIEFSEGFTDLHTKVYEETLAGRGFGIKEARPSVQLTHDIRQSPLSPIDTLAHPFLRK
ncbi:MAG: UDP-N-acetyl-2-amino-2-deoxy-D-glucuronate oxidase [Anaerolineaceae bacterium]|nr:MAG: UDP-N-acetyl-2-amino-2-deoxy-D-glucuronate oxidase [Anaerolineaceae bacterium]